MNGDDDIFADALALPAAERAAFLTGACQGNAAQRARVEALLAGYERAQDILNSPHAPRVVAVPEEAIGDLIGRYKLLQKIGEGGMGVVYLAGQEEPVRRRVALKIIKLGMDTKAVVTRFEAERQALAMMDHPNIARVFDGGATDAGRPYFVMELVRGVRITEYCDAAALSTRERLGLFIQVCQAIQHAHQKGIVHRDIKPSNILVTVNDGVAVPKVIDFGIAKATEGRLTDETVITQFEALIGTPAYMSPEQTLMSSVDIDTRSDIYSLGVLLYEMLAGRTPFETKALLAAGLDEMRKTIREKEPIRPSTRLATLRGDELTDTARHRSADTSKLVHQLQGDLDWIVMKCLEKDRARRYETANGLAADLKRHLDNEPVTARPPSTAYRFQKMVRRNRLAFGAAGVVTLTVIAGLSFSMVSFLREREALAKEMEQRRTAVEQRSKAVAAGEAERQERLRADAEKINAQRHLYVAKMALAQQAWEKTDMERLKELLHETSEFPDRGFEWYYWQQQTHIALKTLRGYLSHDANVWAVAYSPDGTRIVTGNGDHNGRVWDAATGDELFTLKGHNSAFQAVAFSPDSRRIVTASRDMTAKVWDAATGVELFTLTGHSGPLTSVAYSPDGLRIATGSQDKTAMLWDSADGSVRTTLKGHTGRITKVEFSPDSRRIVTGSLDKTAKVWDSAGGPPLFTLLGHASPIWTIAVSPDGQRIATGSHDQSAKLWDASTGKELRTLKGHTGPVRDVGFSPDSQSIVTGSADATARVWDVASGEELLVFKGHSGPIWGVAYSPDGKQFVTSSNDQTARVWDASRGSGPIALKGVHSARVGALSPNGRLIVTGGNDWTARIWDAASGRELHPLKGHAARIGSVAFSSDGERIATGSYDNTARIWDAAGRAEPLTVKGHIGPIVAVAFSPDGKRIVTGSQDFTARTWDSSSGSELLSIKGHTGPVLSVAYSPDSRQIVTGSQDNTARLWDAANGRELQTLTGHAAPILSVAFSADGQRVATGSSDRMAKVWDTATGRMLLTLQGHTAPIISVAYSP
ncbi:MAG: serine/threonine-protein kinase, partial [Opitutaceae bacterium]